jgi:hypothetical protein
MYSRCSRRFITALRHQDLPGIAALELGFERRE